MRFAILMVNGKRYILTADNIIDACNKAVEVSGKDYKHIDLVYCLEASEERA